MEIHFQILAILNAALSTSQCGTCQVLICGECAAVDSHHSHKDIRRIKDVLEELKTHVTKKVDNLEKKVVANLKISLQEVDDVLTQLGKRAKEVRMHIQEEGQPAKDMVDGHTDDTRGRRRGRIPLQLRFSVSSETESSHISMRPEMLFSSAIMTCNPLKRDKKSFFSLLHALETRADSLVSVGIGAATTTLPLSIPSCK